jgi:GT2 family glycosyltransferase
MTDVGAVVITHGPDPDLAACLDALASDVAELVVVENLPDLGEPLPPTARRIQNARPVGFAANANKGVEATTSPYVLIVNPDAVAQPGAVRALAAFMDAHPKCGIAGAEMHNPDGSWQPSRRRFPTVWGTLVRRTPLRKVLEPKKYSRAHYILDERPTEPVEAEWMLGGFLLLRRTMLEELKGFDDGYRLYGEDIDLCYRAARAGWERWYIPGAIVTHRLGQYTLYKFFTRRTIWHWRGMARFVRKHPERLKSLW